MISQQMIIQEIEQQLQRVKSARTPADFQAGMTAIQALCNVSLRTEVEPTVQPIAPSQSLVQRPFKEDDANGESLFDF